MEPTLASIIIFAGNFAPRGWTLCQGQLLSISSNSALFSLLGTSFGGDGRTTFGLPDFRGRTPMHAGRGIGLQDMRLGEKGGVELVNLQLHNLPPHTHSGVIQFGVSSNSADKMSPVGGVPATGSYNAYDPAATADGKLGGVAATSGQAGNSQPVEIRQPFLAIHFIICTSGIYPSRS